MSERTTRRRAIGAVAVLLAAALGGSVALQLQRKAANAAAAAKTPVTLEFAPADLAQIEVKPLPRFLPVSGAVQPVNQATVKAKVVGDVREIRVREGETVRAGQVLARIDTADLEARLGEKFGALEAAKAQLALAGKTRTMNLALLRQNFISQNAYDNSDSTLSVSKGTVKSAEAQVQLARNALADAIVASPLSGIAAMIGGMLPLALGLGEGGETQAPMGRAIIGGVVTSTLLTLVVVPVLYAYLAAWAERRRARRAVKRTSTADAQAAPSAPRRPTASAD